MGTGSETGKDAHYKQLIGSMLPVEEALPFMS